MSMDQPSTPHVETEFVPQDRVPEAMLLESPCSALVRLLTGPPLRNKDAIANAVGAAPHSR